jgi:NAD(P)-dependent dehydrogenase (short-subunit alcohol dehydrogenase family)
MTWTVEGKTCVVTGASDGIGFFTARDLARAGATVAMVCRNEEKGLSALRELRKATGTGQGRAELLLCDVSDFAQVRRLAKDLLKRFPRIEVLVNNAGGYFGGHALSVDGFERTWATNHLGPYLLTRLLLDRLVASAPGRIVNVASRAHKKGRIHWHDPNAFRGFWPGMRAYRQSKLANVLFTRELARRLDGRGVTANALHPGVIATKIAAKAGGPVAAWAWRLVNPFMLTPEQGARTQVWAAMSPELNEISGRYFVACREVPAARQGRDDEAARRLWDLSAKSVGLDGGDGV